MNDAAPWLERELARQLAPVAAPESLWIRMHEPRRSAWPGASIRWMLWPAVAALTLAVCAGVFREVNLRGTEKLTSHDLAELAAGGREFDFRSSDFGAVRLWVKAKADIDIDVPEEPAGENARVRVLGVRLIRLRGFRVAAIDYRAGEDLATLLVSAKHSGLRGNGEVKMKSGGNTRLISWNMRNQIYAISVSGAEDVHGACLLCHANVPGLITIH